MKNKFPLVAILLFGVSSLFSQINYWAWADQNTTGYGALQDNGSLCAADSFGNVCVTGAFNSATMRLGNITLNRFTGDSADNIFLAKYNSAGDVVWAKAAGGDGLCYSRGIAVDPTGNVYVSGWFFGDSMVFENTTLKAKDIFVTIQAGYCFIAKYDAGGNLAWAKTQDTTTNGALLANTIACDALGNFYVAGGISANTGPLVFDGVTLASSTVATSDVALVKFDGTGHPLWARTGNCTVGASYAFSLVTNAAGTSTFTGDFDGNATFGTTALTGSNTNANFFVAQYDSAGIPQWAHGSGALAVAIGTAINTDNAGNVYVAGTYTADSFTLGPKTLYPPAAGDNIFLAKYDATGTINWLTAAGTDRSFGPYSIAFDSTGNVIVAGATDDSVFIAGHDTLKTDLNADIFVEAFGTAGNFEWAKTYGGIGFDLGYVCSNQHGNIFLTGMFSSDTIVLDNYTFISTQQPGYHYFIASVGYQTPTGVQAVANHVSMQIYPNPTTGSFTVAVPTGADVVTITNTLGQTIETRTVQGLATTNFQLNNNGIYLIQVKTATGVATREMVVSYR